MTSTNSLLSAYERAREENIVRNREQLERLGLLGIVKSSVKKKRSPVSDRQSYPSPSPATSTGRVPRRSERLRNREQRIYKDGADVSDKSVGTTSKRLKMAPGFIYSTRIHWISAPRLTQSNLHNPDTKSTPTATTANTNGIKSSSELRVAVKHLRTHYLGKPFTCTGKQTVVEESVVGSHNGGVRFAKLQGYLMWENAVYLWTNLAQPNNPYCNPFSIVAWDKTAGTSDGKSDQPAADVDEEEDSSISLEDYRKMDPRQREDAYRLAMTWYASPRSHKESAVVQRLLSDDYHQGKVHLFCRLLPTEPYIYFGQLRLSKVDTSVPPFAFRYHLLDSEQLMREPSASVPAILQLAQTHHSNSEIQ